MLPPLADADADAPPKTPWPNIEPDELAAGEFWALALPPKMELPANGDAVVLAPPKIEPPEAADVAVAGAGDPKILGLTLDAAAWPKILPPELAPVAAAGAATVGLAPNDEAAADANNPVGGAVAAAAPKTLASGFGTFPNIFAVGVAAV